ncbi:redoxin domain-containing protein [Ochrobactrum vermis]|uniref:Redoxin domain-containing protein n=1 Tax=Ochrobactrum vermis TaxID=1827297 RepID=A0ABU8PN65_9HYPH|nr:redoxin domain-containing protein [Ochrobactrum vermis]PQZ24496.1 alkyl hydroperoxide reductase [Ochrobactrum vermis]
MNSRIAPPLLTSGWLNTSEPLDVSDFRGRVLVIEAFQMLCPGCVSQGLPQAQRIAQTFPADQVAVIGLHTVFEHHEVQGTRDALAAFVHEYRLSFPVGIDRQNGRLPATMTAYEMQGTPTLVVIDRSGARRFQQFGHVDDLRLGSIIGMLLRETAGGVERPSEDGATCNEVGCPVPSGS